MYFRRLPIIIESAKCQVGKQYRYCIENRFRTDVLLVKLMLSYMTLLKNLQTTRPIRFLLLSEVWHVVGNKHNVFFIKKVRQKLIKWFKAADIVLKFSDPALLEIHIKCLKDNIQLLLLLLLIFSFLIIETIKIAQYIPMSTWLGTYKYMFQRADWK